MIKIIYEDENLVVVDKPANLIVHPGAGETGETLVDWFLKNYPEVKKLSWAEPQRAGIVHRLDKNTSGLIILAKKPQSMAKLQEIFQSKTIEKKYQALVLGKLAKKEDAISGFIGRDPHARRQQITKAIHFNFEPGKVRQSKTYYKVLKEYRYNNYDLSLIEATLDTGRMHQIRVHFKSIGHPVIGDPTYNIKHSRLVSKKLELNRQFLHSYKLSFENPFSHQKINLKSDLPEDLKQIILKLK